MLDSKFFFLFFWFIPCYTYVRFPVLHAYEWVLWISSRFFPVFALPFKIAHRKDEDLRIYVARCDGVCAAPIP